MIGLNLDVGSVFMLETAGNFGLPPQMIVTGTITTIR
jgi:hypothetical protein